VEEDPLAGREARPPDADEPALPEKPAEERVAPAEEPAPAGSVAATPDVDYRDRWLRTEAELQNLRRRARRELEDATRAAEEAVLLDLVSWLDDLDRALEAATGAGAAPSWVEGVALVLQKGREYLERQGVVAVDPLGQPFDPAYHEAVLEVDAPEGMSPGHVTQVIHKGYRRGTRTLRAARVVVARAPGGPSR
jgi:molecular chaperone GrpE